MMWALVLVWYAAGVGATTVDGFVHLEACEREAKAAKELQGAVKAFCVRVR